MTQLESNNRAEKCRMDADMNWHSRMCRWKAEVLPVLWSLQDETLPCSCITVGTSTNVRPCFPSERGVLSEYRARSRYMYATVRRHRQCRKATAGFVHLAEQWRKKQLPVNLLTPNVNYSGRTAPLTSKVAFYIFIQQI